jgi:hypothetical protein
MFRCDPISHFPTPSGLQGANFTAGGHAVGAGLGQPATRFGKPRIVTRHASDPSEQPKDQDNDQNGAEQTMRSVTKTITTGRERTDQQQDDNDE